MVEILHLGRGRTKNKGFKTEKTRGLSTRVEAYSAGVSAVRLRFYTHGGTWGIKARANAGPDA